MAEKSIFWTRRLLQSSVEDPVVRQRRLDFLANLPRSHQEGDVLHVHGSPRNHLHEYVFPEDIYNQRKMSRLAEKFDRVCFNGHTHVPGLFVQLEADRWDFLSAADLPAVYRLDGRKVICNVGAVGQPRDGDWRACYALFDGETIRFRRVEYDVKTTIKKIYAILELDNFLGDRLRDGR